MEGCQQTKLRMFSLSSEGRKKKKSKATFILFYLIATFRKSPLQICSPPVQTFWWQVRILVVPRDLEDTLLGINIRFSKPFSPSWLSTLGDSCPLFAQMLSSLYKWLCASGLVCCVEAANPLGKELIVIYLKYEHLSEAADGGSRVELPELRAGTVSSRVKCTLSRLSCHWLGKPVKRRKTQKERHLCAGFRRWPYSLTELPYVS